MGLIYAAVSALAYGLLEALKKRATRWYSSRVIFWALVTFSAPLFVIALIFSGIPDLDPRLWAIIAFDVPLLVLTNILLIKAEKISPLSTSLPLLSLTPIFLIFTAFIFLRETPSVWGIVGIFLIVSGALFLKGEDMRQNLRERIRVLLADRGNRYILVIAVAWSFNAIFTKAGITYSSVFFYTTALVVFESIIMTVWLIGQKEFHRGFSGKHVSFLFIISFVAAVALITYVFAIEKTLVAYVIAIKRVGFIAGGLAFGAFLFREKNITYRIGGAVLMALGVVLILFA